jgi:UDP-N-acetylglucosamine/UDP-N-acetylgalactosamine 4-epimerase
MDRVLNNKKILITGGAGFIGSNLISKLIQQNNSIICLDNFSTGFKNNIKEFDNAPNYKLIEGDIRDYNTCKNAVKNIDIVFHQAALGSVPRSINNPLTTNEVNITGFLNVLQASVEENVSRFIYAASSSTYGDNENLPKIEDVIGNPKSPYAVTKYVNELYAQVFSDLYGIKTIGLRYFNVFGEKQSPQGEYAAVFPKFIKLLLEHKPPAIHGDGLQSRDFTYIDNVVLANELAATTKNKSALNQVYNIAYGENNSLNELTDLLIKYLSEFDPEISKIKPIYSAERQGDIKHSLASIEKARDLLGYHPKIDVKEGLRKAITWYYNRFKI